MLLLSTVNDTTMLSPSYFIHCLTLIWYTLRKKTLFMTGSLCRKRKSYYSESAPNVTVSNSFMGMLCLISLLFYFDSLQLHSTFLCTQKLDMNMVKICKHA